MICIYRALETYGLLCWISGGALHGVRAQTLQRFDLQGHPFQTNDKREIQRAILPCASPYASKPIRFKCTGGGDTAPRRAAEAFDHECHDAEL